MSDWGSPYYKESHIRLRNAIRGFVDKELMPYCHEWDEAKQIPKSLYEKAGRFGLLSCIAGTHIPNEYLPVSKLPGNIEAGDFDAFHEFIVCDEVYVKFQNFQCILLVLI